MVWESGHKSIWTNYSDVNDVVISDDVVIEHPFGGEHRPPPILHMAEVCVFIFFTSRCS